MAQLKIGSGLPASFSGKPPPKLEFINTISTRENSEIIEGKRPRQSKNLDTSQFRLRLLVFWVHLPIQSSFFGLPRVVSFPNVSYLLFVFSNVFVDLKVDSD